MKVVDIASNIWAFELDEPTDVSVASIAQKLRVSIGKLNNLINTNFYIDQDTFEIINADNGSEISTDQVAIYILIFLDYFYLKQAKAFLGAAGVDVIKSINQDGIIVTMVEKNNMAKSYLELRKQNTEQLKQLLNNYKFNRATARQVETDDRLPIRPPLLINPLNNASTY